jgi:hypothetical protein
LVGAEDFLPPYQFHSSHPVGAEDFLPPNQIHSGHNGHLKYRKILKISTNIAPTK